MMKPSRWILGAAMALTVAASLAAQPTADAEIAVGGDSDPVQTPLAEINASLVRIAAALEAQLEERGLELLMKRVELNQSRLQRIEGRILELRAERESLVAQKTYSESTLRQMTERAENGEPAMSALELDQLKSRLETENSVIDSKIEAIDDELAILENEATQQRREVEAWQAYVDRRLGEL